MSLKLKVLGLGLLAVMAMGAVAVMNAGATVSGHFTSSANTTTITGIESLPTHTVELSAPDLSADKIHCKKASYHGHITGTTVTSVTIKPTYSECTTTNSGAVVHVDMKGCAYVLFSRTPVAGKDATVKLECPPGVKAHVLDTGSGCTMQFGEQTVEGAIYDTEQAVGKKHSLTVTITAKKITFTVHKGICVFVPTHQTNGVLEGSVTVTADDVSTGLEADITAT